MFYLRELFITYFLIISCIHIINRLFYLNIKSIDYNVCTIKLYFIFKLY